MELLQILFFVQLLSHFELFFFELDKLLFLLHHQLVQLLILPLDLRLVMFELLDLDCLFPCDNLPALLKNGLFEFLFRLADVAFALILQLSYFILHYFQSFFPFPHLFLYFLLIFLGLLYLLLLYLIALLDQFLFPM